MVYKHKETVSASMQHLDGRPKEFNKRMSAAVVGPAKLQIDKVVEEEVSSQEHSSLGDDES